MDIKEVRIYFEVLEQANHYIKPAIENVLKNISKDAFLPIKLVKLRKNYDLYSTSIKNILEWKDPDILVSLITKTDIELPLFIVEFSKAVFTEDHELQRFDGMVASAENNVVFIKISPVSKISEAEHGGKTDFDFKIPFALIYKKYGIIHFHIDWKSRGNLIEVHDEYLSCPKESSEFEKVLEIIFKSLIINRNGVKLDKDELKKNTIKFFGKWMKDLEAISLKSIIKNLNTSRLHLFNDKRTIEIKINRFGHAMDPERGMIVFYSLLYNKNVIVKMIFDKDKNEWYKNVPKEKQIKEIIKKTGLRKPEDFLRVFYLGSGLQSIIKFGDLKRYVIKSNDSILILNLSKFIVKYWEELNKPLKTIFKFSKQFYIIDKNGNKKVVFKWNNINPPSQEHIERKVTPLKNITDIDEDLVTYITIHNVLKQQNYKILAASYPGAQDDRVILTMAGSGRKQPRRYVDVIAFSIKKNISALQSNKGTFSSALINKEINELKNYKFDINYKKGLEFFFKRFEPRAINSIIRIGVGFWLNERYESSVLKKLKLEDLDYFLFITKDMKNWRVSRIGNVDILDTYEGKIFLPSIWEPAEVTSLDSFNVNGD